MRRGQALTAVTSVPVLAALTPAGTGPAAPLLALVAATAWTCSAWLLLVALLEHATRLPRFGPVAARLARRTAPASVRSLVRAAVGVSLAASLVSGPAALAEDRTPTVAGSTSDALDWPGLAPVTPPAPASAPAPATSRPAPAATAPVQVTQPGPVVVPEAVTVRAGDSLWSLAAQALGPDADAARVAQEWPRWWAANRSVVGDHPDLIHPGDRLSAPRPLGNHS